MPSDCLGDPGKRQKVVVVFFGTAMSSSLGAVGLLFWRKGRGLMPIGSRAESCVRPECLECIIRPSPSRKIPHLTTSHSPCGPSRCAGFVLQADREMAR